MKRLLFTIVLMLVLISVVSAQGIKPTFYGGAGIGLPLKPDNLVPGSDIGLSDMYKSAFNFSGGVGLPLGTNFEVVGRVTYSSFSFDDEGFSDKVDAEIASLLDPTGLGTIDITVEGADVTVLEFIADVKFFIPLGPTTGTFRPFIMAGAGIASATLGEWSLVVDASIPFFPDTTVAIAAEELSETKLVYNFGAGFDWMASPNLGIYAEVRYAQVAVTGDAIGYLPVRVGLIFRPGM